MLTTSIKKAVFFLFVVGNLVTTEVDADRVVLKDGTVEESIRVWETEKYVHFILKGTRSVEIRYSKEIVARIEGVDGTVRPMMTKMADIAPMPPETSTPAPLPKPPSKIVEKAPLAESKDAVRHKRIELDRSVIERNRNVAFYDPRRSPRYWADRQSKHDSYAAAMAALAKMYEHPVEWIEKHMGQDNDLSAIHASLIAAVETASAPPQNQSSIDPIPAEPSKSDDLYAPVESQGIEAEKTNQPAPKTIISGGGPSPIGAIPSGIAFYDPRRSEKYWATPKDHCTTLQDAIQLMAKIYGVPVAYIEANLGESNDLSQIHANIQKSLGLDRR